MEEGWEGRQTQCNEALEARVRSAEWDALRASQHATRADTRIAELQTALEAAQQVRAPLPVVWGTHSMCCALYGHPSQAYP